MKKLSKKHTIGILTTNSREIVDYVLKKGKVGVDFIYTDGSLFRKHKNIKSILQERGLEKQDVIYVGDEVRDIIASRKAGIQVMAVSWGANSRKLLKTEKPDYVHPIPVKKRPWDVEKYTTDKNEEFVVGKKYRYAYDDEVGYKYEGN